VEVGDARPASTGSLKAILMDTSYIREIARMDEPSKSITEFDLARFSRGVQITGIIFRVCFKKAEPKHFETEAPFPVCDLARRNEFIILVIEKRNEIVSFWAIPLLSG
jgi:hypothetical protein